MRVGIICEGATDLAVLEVVLETLLGSDLVLVKLQPDFDRLRLPAGVQVPTGWQAVRTFLREAGPTLAASPLEYIVVQVDADVRRIAEVRAELAQPDVLDHLCEHVKSWLGAGVPPSVIIALPRESVDSWLLAAHTNLKHVEEVERPAAELAARGLIAGLGKTRKRADRPHKAADRYAELARALEPLLVNQRQLARVPELERFATKVRARAAALERATSRRDRVRRQRS